MSKPTPDEAREFLAWVREDMKTANHCGVGYVRRIIENYEVLLAEKDAQ